MSDPMRPTPPGLIVTYAGFWWRVLAFLVDSAVLTAMQASIGFATGLPHLGASFDESSDQSVSAVAWSRSETFGVYPVFHHTHWHGGLLTLISLLLTIAYYVLLESSRWQATLGKRVCRLRVTDLAGRRIGPLRALGRYLGKFVSWILFGIGFLMVAWTRRKQGLHDMMAGTLVMRLREPDPVFAFQPPSS